MKKVFILFSLLLGLFVAISVNARAKLAPQNYNFVCSVIVVLVGHVHTELISPVQIKSLNLNFLGRLTAYYDVAAHILNFRVTFTAFKGTVFAGRKQIYFEILQTTLTNKNLAFKIKLKLIT